MKWYSYVKKGMDHGAGVCEDTVLVGKQISKGGYMEGETGNCFLAAVADGVGGENAGEVASGFTMLRLAQLDAENLSMDHITGELEKINVEIRKMGRNHEPFRGMSSTLVMFGKVSDGIFMANLGNSRLYRCMERNGIRQLSLESTDHNLINDWMRFGEPEGMRIEDIKDTPKADMLTGYMGMKEEIFARKLELEELDLEHTKRIFMASDGIHQFLSYDDVKQFVCAEEMSENLMIQFTHKAIAAGSRDDLSIVVLDIS